MKRDYLSASALKAFAKSPNHYLDYVSGKSETTPAMSFGSALHCFVLERDEFETRYAVAPIVDRRTKEGKKTFAEFTESSQGKEVITAQDYARIQSMSFCIHDHKPSGELLDGCTAFEQVKTGQIQGFDFKGIADGLSSSYILDLKTAQDASPEGFERAAFQNFYHEQAAAYRMLWNVDRFYWIVAEKQNPMNVTVFMQSEEAFHRAKHRLTSLVDDFKNWDGKPRSYSNEILTLNLPKWVK